MSTLLVVVETHRCDTEHQAEELIKEAKAEEGTGGYELVDYGRKLKTKKSKGEIIDSWYIVTLKKEMDTIYG